MTNLVGNLSISELNAISTEFEDASPAEIVQWSARLFGERLFVAVSFQNAVLAHVANSAVPGIEIVLLDTQYLFPETLQYVDTLKSNLGLNVKVAQPASEIEKDDLWMVNPDKCCEMRKVDPLNHALENVDAWITGLRRADSKGRARTPILSFDLSKKKVKINPLATMSDEDFEAYVVEHKLPEHPLTSQGFPSIGCWPCTRRVESGEDKRSGRWVGFDKTECGLHL